MIASSTIKVSSLDHPFLEKTRQPAADRGLGFDPGPPEKESTILESNKLKSTIFRIGL